MKDARIVWPNGAKCAVLLTIHVDGESLYNRDPAHPSPRRVSYGRYGPTRAVNRLLDLAERKGIPCSYFVPGQIAERYPDLVRRIDAHGHEIGFHGFDHEEHMYTDRSTQEWIDVIHRAQDTFEKIIGKRAVGYVATSSDFQMDAPQIWHEQLGFRYSSSMRGMTAPTGRASRGRSRISSRSRPDGSWMTIQPSSTALPHRGPRARTGSPATGGPLQLAA
ncbi:MAG: polysaccharide deacetylase family protein [Flavonifractor plautii]